MPNQTIISFAGLSEEAAEKLAKGLAQTSKAQLSGLLSRADEIKRMSGADVNKMETLLKASVADGNCGWGCSGT